MRIVNDAWGNFGTKLSLMRSASHQGTLDPNLLLSPALGPRSASPRRHGRLRGALGHRGHEVDEAGVPRLLEAPLQLVLHDVDELLVAEAAVAVLVEDDEEDVDHVVGQPHVGANLERESIHVTKYGGCNF